MMHNQQSVPVSSAQFASLVPGDWECIHSQRQLDAKTTFVFQNRQDDRDVRVLSTDLETGWGQQVNIPGCGVFMLSSYRDDPALSDLDSLLHREVPVRVPVRVLRYRPGKRVTVRLDRSPGESIILKCVSTGVRDAYERLQLLYEHRDELAFRVSQPLWVNDAGTVMAQVCLEGVTLQVGNFLQQPSLAGQLAHATASLHRSSIEFPEHFCTADQRRRSERYCHQMALRFPDLVEDLAQVQGCLDALQQKIDQSLQKAVVPIHGALHTHQWLTGNAGLALVDFDRCSMGDAELDIATFLAQWDYEAARLGEPVNCAFMANIHSVDRVRTAFYRAHKHLAKACKASRSIHASAQARVQRNLQRLLWVLAEARRTS